MGHVEQNLMPNEVISHRTTLHWVYCLKPAIFLGSLYLAGFAFGVLGAAEPAIVAFMLTLFLFPLVCLMILLRFISWKTSEFAVTDQRFIVKVGWIIPRTLELLLTKVEAISVKQGILGRELNYGSIVISRTGGIRSPFKHVAEPMALRNKVNNLISGNDQR